jgi:hypothetical protein
VPFCYTNTIRSPPRHTSVLPGRKQLEEVMPRGCAMVVRITPRNDRVLVNEPAGETRHNVGWTEQQRLKGKIRSLHATTVALDALPARDRWRNKRGLFGMLLRLGFVYLR